MTTKTPCQQCGVNIEFDVEQANQFVACPSCSQQTRLLLSRPKPSAPDPKIKSEAKRAGRDGDSVIASILACFGLVDILFGIMGGAFIIYDRRDFPLGVAIIAAGLLAGCVLLGFASLIEHTKASAERLRRIELVLARP